jgi:hypothetical protein
MTQEDVDKLLDIWNYPVSYFLGMWPSYEERLENGDCEE